MYKCVSTGAVMVFCKKYKASYDWLLCGDLKGLKRITQDQHLSKVTPESPKEKLARLSQSEREVVCKVFDQLLEGAS
jgi:hypothetical protein